MATLNDIGLHLACLDWPGDDVTLRRDFNRTVTLVTEIFLSFMPRLVVDGRGKLNIFLGPREPVRRYEPQPPAMGSRTEYAPGGPFDLTAFLGRPGPERFAALVDIIEAALLDICTSCGIEPAPFIEAAARTRATNGELEREIGVLSKSTRDRRVRFRVIRRIRPEGEHWHVALVERDGRIACDVEIAANIGSLAARYEFRHGEVANDVFSLLDGQHRPVFSVTRGGEPRLPFVERRYSDAGH